jgi:hypothetical protein
VGRAFKAPLSSLVPVTLQERLQEEGIEGTVRIQFGDAPGAGRLHLSRAHPLVRLLAEALVETALDNAADPTDPATLPRCGVWRTRRISQITTITLLRVRHRLETTIHGKGHSLLAEEAVLVGFDADGRRLQKDDIPTLIEAAPEGDLPDFVKRRQLSAALTRLPELKQIPDSVARERAAALAADHARVRGAAAQARIAASVKVEPVLPVDVIGLYVLLPVID